jgi:hypothetical protein
MPDFATVVNELITAYPDALAVAVFDSNGKIAYQTSNWDVSADVDRLLQAWKSQNAQFVHLQGVKYSMLQCVNERLIATNFGKQGHLVGASTPDLSFRIIAYISPEAQGWNQAAYPTVARAAAMLSGGSSISEAAHIDAKPSGNVAGPERTQSAPAPAAPSIDPGLKAEIDGFLQWIKDPQGLSGYIEYYLNANDMNVIPKLATVYNEFRKIFNF